MRDLVNFVQGDAFSFPLAPRSLLIDPVSIGAAGVTALGSVLNGIFGFGSQSSANQTNLEIAKQNAELQRETNRQQYQMFKEQNEWNLDQWNRENEYNLPKNQVQRLLDAGINPSGVFGSANTGNASQLMSATAPQLASPQINARVNPYLPDLRVGDAVNAYMQNEINNSLKKKYNAEAAHTETLNLFDKESMSSRLKSLQSIAKGDDWKAEMARMELNYIQDSYYWRIKQLRNDISLQDYQQQEMQERIYNYQLTNGLAEIQLAYAPKLNEAQLKQYYETVNQIRAQVGLINANKLLTEEQKLTEAKRRVGVTIDNGMKGFDFKERKELFGKMLDYTIQSIQGEMSSPEFSTGARWFDWAYDKVRGLIPFASPSGKRQPQTIRRDYYSGGYVESRY